MRKQHLDLLPFVPGSLELRRSGKLTGVVAGLSLLQWWTIMVYHLTDVRAACCWPPRRLSSQSMILVAARLGEVAAMAR
jgi:hypothetical protein